MKSKIYFAQYLFVILSLLIIGCKQKTEKKTDIGSEAPSQAMEEIVDPLETLNLALDPMEVGKEFTKVLSDTLNVQLYEFTMKPGDSVGMHQHLDHTVYVLEGGKIMVYINGVEPVEMELQSGVGFVAGPLTDAAKNTGETTIRLLISEIHRPRVN
jgi:quercetin dioxygenase-like cupin family protein